MSNTVTYTSDPGTKLSDLPNGRCLKGFNPGDMPCIKTGDGVVVSLVDGQTYSGIDGNTPVTSLQSVTIVAG